MDAAADLLARAMLALWEFRESSAEAADLLAEYETMVLDNDVEEGVL